MKFKMTKVLVSLVMILNMLVPNQLFAEETEKAAEEQSSVAYKPEYIGFEGSLSEEAKNATEIAPVYFEKNNAPAVAGVDTFPAPTKGYQFAYWAIANSTDPLQNGTVKYHPTLTENGSARYSTSFGIIDGHLVLVPKWETITYNIQYTNVDGAIYDGSNTTYNILSDINITPASKEGYTFSGWKITSTDASYNLNTINGQTAEINPGTYGNLTVEAVWEEVYEISNYEVSQDYNGKQLIVTASDIITKFGLPEGTKIEELASDGSWKSYVSSNILNAGNTTIRYRAVLPNGVVIDNNSTISKTVNQVPLTITANSYELIGSETIDSKELGFTYDDTNLVNNENFNDLGIKVDLTAKDGVISATANYTDSSKPQNYNLIVKTGTYTSLGDIVVTVTANSHQTKYTGTEQTVTGGTYTVSVNGVDQTNNTDYEVMFDTSNPKATNVGTFENEVSNVKVVYKGEDISASIDRPVLINGTLTITRADLTIKVRNVDIGSANPSAYDYSNSEIRVEGLVGKDIQIYKESNTIENVINDTFVLTFDQDLSSLKTISINEFRYVDAINPVITTGTISYKTGVIHQLGNYNVTLESGNLNYSVIAPKDYKISNPYTGKTYYLDYQFDTATILKDFPEGTTMEVSGNGTDWTAAWNLAQKNAGTNSLYYRVILPEAYGGVTVNNGSTISVEVTKIPLTIKANSYVLVGEEPISNVTLEYTTQGFINGDNIESTNINVVLTPANNVISVDAAYKTGTEIQNYEIIEVDGVYNKYNEVSIILDPSSFETKYTGLEQTVTGGEYRLFINKLQVNGLKSFEVTYNTSSPEEIYPGTYRNSVVGDAVVLFNGRDVTDYVKVSHNIGYLVIDKADVVISADNITTELGKGIPGLTYEVNGLVNNESASVLNLPEELFTTSYDDTIAGEFDITSIVGLPIESDNYNISYTNGLLVSNEAPIITTPTPSPTTTPTVVPTTTPTVVPTTTPTVVPTTAPTVVPTTAPTVVPTTAPTVVPTTAPTVVPTTAPTVVPTTVPTVVPTTTPEVEIEEDQTPEVAPTPTPEVEIEEEVTPEFGGSSWALINLITALITTVISIYLVMMYFKSKKEEDSKMYDSNGNQINEATHRNKLGIRVLSVLIAVIAIFTFILTENMTQPMVLVDEWTILMVVYLLVQIVVAYFSKKSVKYNEVKA